MDGNVLSRYHALPLSAPAPAFPACFDTLAVLKPLPPRNWPVKPCLRASIMIVAGIPPRLVMNITSGFFARALVTGVAKSAVVLLKAPVSTGLVPYWATVLVAVVPP